MAGRPHRVTSKRPSCAKRRWHLPLRCETGTAQPNDLSPAYLCSKPHIRSAVCLHAKCNVMLVARQKLWDIKNTLIYELIWMKQCLNIKMCRISLHRLGYQYTSVCLQIEYLSVSGLNLDENLKFVRNFVRKWWFWTDEKWHFGSMFVQSLAIRAKAAGCFSSVEAIQGAANKSNPLPCFVNISTTNRNFCKKIYATIYHSYLRTVAELY